MLGRALPLLLLIAAVPASADVISWNNALGGSWETPGNWSPPQVPGAADDARITLAGTYSVTLGASTGIRSLTLGAASGTQTLTSAGSSTLALAESSAVLTGTASAQLQSITVAGPGVLAIAAGGT